LHFLAEYLTSCTAQASTSFQQFTNALRIAVNLALVSFSAMMRTVFVQRMLSVMYLSLMSYVLQFISSLNVKAFLLMDL
jgi:hypothetical protein